MQKKSLENTESVFWNLITAPEGVEQGLGLHPNIHLEDWFQGDAKMPPMRRLNIYANMYFWRINDCLKEDYPAVVKTIGDQSWRNLMTDYLLTFPSQTPFLQYVGKHLPLFLKKHDLSKKWPFLPDLATLEWEKTIIFEAADSNYLSVQDLQNIPPKKWPALRIRFIPAFKILKLDWDVTATKPKKKKTAIKIWRKDFGVCQSLATNQEQEVIELIQTGNPFEKVCEKLQSAETAAHYFVEWLQSGLVAKI